MNKLYKNIKKEKVINKRKNKVQYTDFLPSLVKLRKKANDNPQEGLSFTNEEEIPIRIVRALNKSLATEIVSSFRYRAQAIKADGVLTSSIVKEFYQHAEQEMEHALWLAERIGQLGGIPDFSPKAQFEKSLVKYEVPSTLGKMIYNTLVSERLIVEYYKKMIRWIGDADPTTRRLLEKILETEEHHVDDLAGLLRETQSNQVPQIKLGINQ